jgi:hypothetical protein
MMELPMKLFVGWLVVKAAEADQEDPPESIKLIPDLRQRSGAPRCRSCGRFLSYTLKKSNMDFCSAVCFDKTLQTLQPKRLPPPNVTAQACHPEVPTTSPGRHEINQAINR